MDVLAHEDYDTSWEDNVPFLQTAEKRSMVVKTKYHFLDRIPSILCSGRSDFKGTGFISQAEALFGIFSVVEAAITKPNIWQPFVLPLLPLLESFEELLSTQVGKGTTGRCFSSVRVNVADLWS